MSGLSSGSERRVLRGRFPSSLVARRLTYATGNRTRGGAAFSGAAQELGLSPEGYARRQDTMITHVLLVGPELAEDPYGSKPVIEWCDVRDREPNPGAWPVKAEQDRTHWDWTPLESIGPLTRNRWRPRSTRYQPPVRAGIPLESPGKAPESGCCSMTGSISPA